MAQFYKTEYSGFPCSLENLENSWPIYQSWITHEKLAKKQNALENLGFVLENASCGHTPCIAPDMDAINVTWQLEWPEVQIM